MHGGERLNTKLLMIGSAAVSAALGLLLSFAPGETLRYFHGGSDAALTVLLQVAGAAFLGLALLNWMARDSTIGGIYNRPLATANVLHFGAGAIASAKALLAGHPSAAIIALSICYAVFAVWFGVVIFGRRPAN
jgi:hypothetical protein